MWSCLAFPPASHVGVGLWLSTHTTRTRWRWSNVASLNVTWRCDLCGGPRPWLELTGKEWRAGGPRSCAWLGRGPSFLRGTAAGSTCGRLGRRRLRVTFEGVFVRALPLGNHRRLSPWPLKVHLARQRKNTSELIKVYYVWRFLKWCVVDKPKSTFMI